MSLEFLMQGYADPAPRYSGRTARNTIRAEVSSKVAPEEKGCTSNYPFLMPFGSLAAAELEGLAGNWIRHRAEADLRYLDFAIQVVAEHPHGFAVNVIESPAGEGTAVFNPPFSHEELPRILGDARSSGNGKATRGEPARDLRLGCESEHFSPDRIGQRLFDSLFRGEVLNLYERSLERLDLTASEGLRIKILIDPRNAHLSFLQQLPWELLYSARQCDFIALSRKRPIVRYLMVPHRPSSLPFKRPLRILVVAPEITVSHFSSLDLQRELQNLYEAVSRNPRVKLVRPETPTIMGIRQALLTETFHIIHFMGHGMFDEHSSEGALLFQGTDGAVDQVKGIALAQVLRDFPSLRLLVLNACNSARSGTGEHPFAGVANALVLAGLPAVVAMQYPIADWAAIEFSKAFYTRLAENDPIDAAVAEGRQAIHARDFDSVDWSAPALFMRSPDGQLFSAQDTMDFDRVKRGKKLFWVTVWVSALIVALAIFFRIVGSTSGSKSTAVVPGPIPSITSDMTTDTVDQSDVSLSAATDIPLTSDNPSSETTQDTFLEHILDQ